MDGIAERRKIYHIFDSMKLDDFQNNKPNHFSTEYLDDIEETSFISHKNDRNRENSLNNSRRFQGTQIT